MNIKVIEGLSADVTDGECQEWPVPPQLLKTALQLLEPEPENAAECRDGLATMLRALAFLAHQDQLDTEATIEAQRRARRLTALLRRVQRELQNELGQERLQE